MKTSDIPDLPILQYLKDHEPDWVCLWFGHFKTSDESVTDIYYAMPEGTPHKLALFKMRNLYRRKLVDGCPCSCKGDWELTDKGREYLEKVKNPKE